MSDGSLSQDEIDALLQGTDTVEVGTPASNTNALSFQEKNAMQNLVGMATTSQASTITSLMKPVTIAVPRVEEQTRDQLLNGMAEELVEVRMDFSDGVLGEHLFIISPDDASRIAGGMMGQDEMDLTDAALQAVQELLSQFMGPAITSMSDKTKKNLMTAAPSVMKKPKAAVQLPIPSFLSVTFPIKIEGNGSVEIVEIFATNVVKDMVKDIVAASAPVQQMQQPMMQQQNMQQMQQQQMPQYQQQMPQYQQQMPYMGQMPMQPMNVQSVQFPGLQGGRHHGETQNIGLLMDVFMEMTVELGRTKKMLSEILQMGEGTIIELDKLAGEPVDILVNHKLIARGEVVVIDENFGVRVTEIIQQSEKTQEP